MLLAQYKAISFAIHCNRLLRSCFLFYRWPAFPCLAMAEEKLVIKAENHTFPGFKKEEESWWRGPFSFIQGADTQFGFIENYIEKRADPGWEKEEELTRRAVAAVNAIRPRPRFFVVCGDLVDAFPGTPLRRAQEQSFFQAFRELHPDIPLVCVCGNHDVGDNPTQESIETYKSKFGDNYFSFFCGGVMFIVINSQFYKAPEQVEDLAAEHDKWLDEQLEEAKTGKYKHVVIFQHIPWFIRNPDEEDLYFNIKTEIREKMLKKFYDANVRAVFCGHWHGNAGGFYKELEVVVTSAIGGQLRGDRSGLRVVRVLDSGIRHTYYALEDVPEEISWD